MSYLPQAEGLLPKWQLIVSGMAFFNAAQNFATLKLTRRIYGNVSPPLGSKFLVRRFLPRYLLTEALFEPSDGAASKDLRGLDGPLRRRAPLCSV